VDKPLTDGYVSLYAWDYGRIDQATLIGQYHPSETNPRYRRIKIGKPNAWVRILYRVKAEKVTSVYDYLPLEQTRAISMAVHAVDLENKDFFDQAQRFWARAYSYLQNQQDVTAGQTMETIQVNGLCYGDMSDPVVI